MELLRPYIIKVLPVIKQSTFSTRNAMSVTQILVGFLDSLLVYWARQSSLFAVVREH